MRDRLIITNGDSAVARMREAGIAGEILPWRDILHEGPVPAAPGLEELSSVRAQFLARPHPRLASIAEAAGYEDED